MAEIKTELVLNLRGDLAEQLARTSRQVRQFSMAANRNLSGLGRTSAIVSRNLDRMGNKYMALATGGAGAAASKFVIDSQRQMTRLANKANLTAEQIDDLKKRIYEVVQAPDVRIDFQDLYSAIDLILEKTGDEKFSTSTENLRNFALAIQAAGAGGQEIGQLAAEFQKLGANDPESVMKIFDIFNVQGKEGSFGVNSLAKLSSRVLSAYAPAVKGTRDAVTVMKELGAVLQVINTVTGSPEQTATTLESLMADLQDVSKLKKLRRLGIQVFDPNQPGLEAVRPLNEIMVEILEKTKGRRTIFGQIFGAQSGRAFNKPVEDMRAMFDGLMKVTGDGTQTMRDSARAANDAAGALQNLKTAAEVFADRNLAGGIQDMANALNGVSPDTGQQWLDTAGNIALAVGGIVGAHKLWHFGRKYLLGPAKYLMGPTLTGALGTRMGAFSPTNPGPMLAVAAAGFAGVKTGEAIYDNLLQGTPAADRIGGTMASVMASLGSSNAQAALQRLNGGFEGGARPVDLGGTLKIEIGMDGQLRLRQAQKNGPLDFDIRSGPLALGAGQ